MLLIYVLVLPLIAHVQSWDWVVPTPVYIRTTPVPQPGAPPIPPPPTRAPVVPPHYLPGDEVTEDDSGIDGMPYEETTPAPTTPRPTDGHGQGGPTSPPVAPTGDEEGSKGRGGGLSKKRILIIAVVVVVLVIVLVVVIVVIVVCVQKKKKKKKDKAGRPSNSTSLKKSKQSGDKASRSKESFSKTPLQVAGPGQGTRMKNTVNVGWEPWHVDVDKVKFMGPLVLVAEPFPQPGVPQTCEPEEPIPEDAHVQIDENDIQVFDIGPGVEVSIDATGKPMSVPLNGPPRPIRPDLQIPSLLKRPSRPADPSPSPSTSQASTSQASTSQLQISSSGTRKKGSKGQPQVKDSRQSLTPQQLRFLELKRQERERNRAKQNDSKERVNPQLLKKKSSTGAGPKEGKPAASGSKEARPGGSKEARPSGSKEARPGAKGSKESRPSTPESNESDESSAKNKKKKKKKSKNA